LLEEGATAATVNVSATLNGMLLQPTPNVSSLYGEGPQATMALFPPARWRAFTVPTSVVTNGNNTIAFAITGDGGETGYTLVHTASGGDGQRWRFPAGYEPNSNVSGLAMPGVDLLQCERLCDNRSTCIGVYSDAHKCFALDQLLVVTHTALQGGSYARKVSLDDGSKTGNRRAAAILRLELSLPVTTTTPGPTT
jgi:hypothetical protein